MTSEMRRSRADDLICREDDGKPTLRGYAAVFYDGTPKTEFKLWDGAVERIMPGAFQRAIAKDDIRGLKNHDPNMLLARNRAGTLRLWEDEKGLRYEMLLANTSVAKDTIEDVRVRNLTGSSFSFRILKETWTKADEESDEPTVRSIQSVKLFDVGPVAFPAYEATEAEAASAFDRKQAREDYENWCRIQAALTEYKRRARLIAESEANASG